MRGQKIGARNAIAVGEEQVIAAGFDNRPVKNRAFAKAAILMPHVTNGQARFSSQPINRLPSCLGGAIVGDQQFKLTMRLRGISPDGLFQPLGLIESAEDDGGVHSVGTIAAEPCGIQSEINSAM